MRFEPTQDAHGNWRVSDTGYLLAGAFFNQGHAMAQADLMNAINDGEPANVIDDLRRDRDNARNGG